jgi:ribosome-binding protein aMBF1 (putative translation factor)
MSDLSHLPTADEVHREDYENDPEYTAEHDRLRLASYVSIAVLRYRMDRGLSQATLAGELGMKQPAVARLEAADHQPSVDMLQRLAAAGILTVEILADGTHVRALAAS